MVNTQNGISVVNIGEIGSIRIPQSIVTVTNTNDIDTAFTIYHKTSLFPIRQPPPNTIVGSSVIGARIGGVTDGTKVPDPVVINLALRRIAVSD